MKIVLDTNIIYAYLTKSDPNHDLAALDFQSIKESDQIIIPIIVVCELLAGIEDTKLLFELLSALTSRLEPSNLEDIQFIRTIEFSTRKSLKSNDCAILAISKRTKAKLLTHDQRLLAKFNDMSKL